MLHKYRKVTGFAGLVLVGVYSSAMMATSGSATWAWLILVAAIVLLAFAARSGADGGTGRRDA